MTLPPLPSLRELTRQLKELHEAWSHPEAGGGEVCLAYVTDGHGEDPGWRVMPCDNVANIHRSVLCDTAHAPEYIPGSVERECACRPLLRKIAARQEQIDSWPCAECHGSGRVHVPTPFDATAAARRLLAAARDGGAA